MALSWRWWVVVPVILGGMLLAACGGDGDNGEPADAGPSDEGVATMEPAGEATVEEEEDEDEGPPAAGDSFEGVPVPSGARETGSGQWSGTIPGVVPGAGADPADFTRVEFRQYEVDDSPSDVVEFYRENLKGWEEGFVFSGDTNGDEGGVGVWTRDNGTEAIWLSASRSDGVTELIVIRGSVE